ASLDKPDSIANALVQSTSLTGDTDYLNALAREIDAVTPSMLQEYARKGFLDANRTTVTLTSQAAARPQRKPAAKTAKGGGGCGVVPGCPPSQPWPAATPKTG